MILNLKELLEFRKDNKLEPRQKIVYHIVCTLEDFDKRLEMVESKMGLFPLSNGKIKY